MTAIEQFEQGNALQAQQVPFVCTDEITKGDGVLQIALWAEPICCNT